MQVLVTGAGGIVGAAAVRQLLDHGHAVRIVGGDGSEHGRWPDGVDLHAGHLIGAATGCDAILHAADTLSEDDGVTFEIGNVESTRAALIEAERAGVGRFVLVSSLGATQSESPYHRSRAKAEALVREHAGGWTICRTGYAYGPGDPIMAQLMRMVQILPLIPVISGGGQPFQPVAASDLAEGLVRVIERRDLTHSTLELAGTDVTTLDEVIGELSRVTGKSPRIVSVPSWMAEIGARAAEVLGVGLPVKNQQIAALVEPGVIPQGRSNALVGALGVRAMTLREGLTRLASTPAEHLPEDGTGPLWRRRYWSDIEDSAYTADTLFALLRDEFGSPPSTVTFDRDAGPRPRAGFAEGETLTMHLPLRGEVPMRVEQVKPHVIMCVMLEGHPLRGAVRFLAEQRGQAMRFEVQSYDRATNLPERMAMAAAGSALMNLTWRAIVERMVQRTGGRAVDGVRLEEERLPSGQALEVEEWIRNVVRNRRSQAADRRRQRDRRRARAFTAPDRRGQRDRRLTARL